MIEIPLEELRGKLSKYTRPTIIDELGNQRELETLETKNFGKAGKASSQTSEIYWLKTKNGNYKVVEIERRTR